MTQDNSTLQSAPKPRLETTINIDRVMYEKLTEAAKHRKMSRSRLIGMLITLFAQNEKKPDISSGTVKYQESQPEENWKKLHIVIPPYA